MLTTKDLIEALSKYPDGTEWEVVGDRCITSELGVIDLEAMVGNDLGGSRDESIIAYGRYDITMTDERIEFNNRVQRLPFDRVSDWDEGILPRAERPKYEFIKSDKEQQADIFIEAGKL